MRKTFLLVASVMIVMGTLFGSCSKKDDNKTTLTLYDSLGGTAKVTDPSDPTKQIEKGRLGIRSVVDSTIFIIAADTAINSYFTVLLAEVTANNLSGFTALSKNLTDFFCVATGAKNFKYAGLDMVSAHDPAKNPRINAKVDSNDFNAFVADLVKGAKKNGLSDQLIARVGAVVGSVEGQVVQK